MQIMIIKSVLCVTLLLAMLSYYIGPKRTRTLFGALWIISLILLWVLILL
jgi:hypothetical protein